MPAPGPSAIEDELPRPATTVVKLAVLLLFVAPPVAAVLGAGLVLVTVALLLVTFSFADVGISLFRGTVDFYRDALPLLVLWLGVGFAAYWGWRTVMTRRA